jgi:hypothetical protein
MVVHDWHKSEDEIGVHIGPQTHVQVEPVYRAGSDGALYLRCVNKQGEILSIAMSAQETDRLAEFLWTERK